MSLVVVSYVSVAPDPCRYYHVPSILSSTDSEQSVVRASVFLYGCVRQSVCVYARALVRGLISKFVCAGKLFLCFCCLFPTASVATEI